MCNDVYMCDMCDICVCDICVFDMCVCVIYVFDMCVCVICDNVHVCMYVCDNIHVHVHVLSSSASFKVLYSKYYTIKYQHYILIVSLFNLCCLYIADQRQV